ncbi:MAG: nickel-dependent hydrogenase large subunit [Candidatus Bipolaricaulia bacterium]
MRTIVIDPVTRIEGHLKIEAIVDDGVVKETRSTGTLFRGIELILQGRDPRDAPRITQRICGVCPTAHATASTFALDEAFGISERIPANGRVIRNLILGCNFIQSHVLHFYHLAALDYVDVTEVATYEGTDPGLLAAKAFLARGELGPFVPRYEGDYRFSTDVAQRLASHYVQAFDIRRKAHELLAVFGGKMPHSVGIVPGGVTQAAAVDTIAGFLWRLNELRHFIDHVYVPDIVEVARHYVDYAEIGAGSGKFLDYGGFPQRDGRYFSAGTIGADLVPAELDSTKITESVTHSWYADGDGPLHPTHGKTVPMPEKEDAYSWLKSPRYDGEAYEGGPLARMLLSYARGEPAKEIIDGILSELGLPATALNSVLGRHAARAVECKLVADAMADWVLDLAPGEPVYAPHEIPDEGEGTGLTAAPRGALGHWVRIRGGKIDHYQCVVPTTWNASPKDDRDQPGPIEQAIVGTQIRDEENPFEIVRIVRSFDPCLACAVHVITPRGRTIGRYAVG